MKVKGERHKYAISVSESAVKDDTEQLVSAVIRRHKGEYLGKTKGKLGGMVFGASLTPASSKLVMRDLNFVEHGEVRIKDYGVDDGKRRKTAPADTPKKRETPPPPLPKRAESEDGDSYKPPPILPVDEQFKGWADIGSPEHKRAVALLGADCENRSMKWWGKFQIDRHYLFAVLIGELRNDKEFAKYMRENLVHPSGYADYYVVSWKNLRPFVYKAFKKSDAEFIEAHTAHGKEE